MAVIFPLKLLREQSHDWNIIGAVATAGQTVTSSVDVRSDGGGFWSASLNDIQFRDQSHTLLWRAVRQLCRGGVVPIVVPRNDSTFGPFPANGSRSFGDLPFGDDSLFSDGAGFSQPVIDVTCSAAAARRAGGMIVQLNNCAPLQGGESFSINHPTFGWRLYEIGSAQPIDSSHTVISFNPPLREAVGAGERLEFDLPRCTMKLATPATMDLNVTTWPFSVPSVKFIESRYA